MCDVETLLSRLRALLRYEPETGAFVWIAQPGPSARRAVIGERAGTPNQGYTSIKIDGKQHKAHRLAVLFTTGKWPVGSVDHINGIKSDNRLCNLRDVVHRVNCQNQIRCHKNNGTGILGVSKKRNGFQARIRVNGRPTHLGSFKTAEMAREAYLQAKREHHAGNTL